MSGEISGGRTASFGAMPGAPMEQEPVSVVEPTGRVPYADKLSPPAAADPYVEKRLEPERTDENKLLRMSKYIGGKAVAAARLVSLKLQDAAEAGKNTMTGEHGRRNRIIAAGAGTAVTGIAAKRIRNK